MAKPSKKVLSDESQGQPMNSGLPSEGENIDKIRDILFGSQTRQIEKKMVVMEDKIDKEIASLRSEKKTALDTLEQFLRKEIAALSDQLTSEKTERAESVESLSDKVTDAKKTLIKNSACPAIRWLRTSARPRSRSFSKPRTCWKRCI